MRVSVDNGFHYNIVTNVGLCLIGSCIQRMAGLLFARDSTFVALNEVH